MPSTRPAEYLAGDDALARGAWAEACQASEETPGARELPEALEGLGNAAWWLDLSDLVFNGRFCAHAGKHEPFRVYDSDGNDDCPVWAGARRIQICEPADDPRNARGKKK